jgi:hypothetical protein
MPSQMLWPLAVSITNRMQQSQTITTMNKKEEKIRYAINQLIGRDNLDVVVKIFSPDYVAHAGEKRYKGHKFLKQFTKQLRTAIPDIQPNFALSKRPQNY